MTHILDDAIDRVYEKGGEYGKPEDSFPIIAEMWEAYLERSGRPIEATDVAYMMVLLKVARAAGGVQKDENDIDIAGYVENAARIREERRFDGTKLSKTP